MRGTIKKSEFIYLFIVSHMTGKNLDSMAHWELLTPDIDLVVDENLRDSDSRCKFYAPIASGAAHEEPISGYPLKMNY